jgi:two-component system sensor histidine kinase RegB
MAASPLLSTLPLHDLLGRLFAVRILLILGWAIGIAWLVLGLGIVLPWRPMLAVLALSAAFVGFTAWRLRRGFAATQAEVLAQLLTDLTAFAVLVFFSGGVTNPFVSLMLLPVVVAAISLAAPWVWLIAAIASLYYLVLLFWHVPLAFADAATATAAHLAGMWFNFVVSAALVAFFVTRMNASLRERERQLARLREQTLRDERLLALGMQAAGAAHELATPLATIAMTAEALAHEFANDPDIAPPAMRLVEQATACKRILDRLAGRARAAPDLARPFGEWLGALVDDWQILRPDVHVTLDVASAIAPRPCAPPEALATALLNLFNNAADASPQAVDISAAAAGTGLAIDIADRGPGFDPQARRLAGRVLFTGKPGRGLGLGLGLSHASIERLGGEVILMAREGGGSVVRVRLPESFWRLP